MTDITALIHRYFELAPQSDSGPYFAQFADDAVATDEGHDHLGIDAIRAWRHSVPLVTYTVRDVAPTGLGHTGYAEIAGDFPGSPVELGFYFEITDDGKIDRLVIG